MADELISFPFGREGPQQRIEGIVNVMYLVAEDLHAIVVLNHLVTRSPIYSCSHLLVLSLVSIEYSVKAHICQPLK